MTGICAAIISYKQTDTCCVSQGSVITLIFLQIHSRICVPKIINIEHSLTELLRK